MLKNGSVGVWLKALKHFQIALKFYRVILRRKKSLNEIIYRIANSSKCSIGDLTEIGQIAFEL